MIKAIEKCSLQATFGPELTSTGELLLKRSDVSSALVTLRASHDSTIEPVGKRTLFDRIPLFSTKPRINAGLLPTDPNNEDNNSPSNLTTNNGGMPVVLTNQDGNIPRERSKGGSMRAISTHEDGMTTFRQSNLLGRVPLEDWGQRVSYHAYNALSTNQLR